MHGSCAGNIKQIFIMFGFVSSAVCIGEDDFIKFQAFGHPDGSDRDAVLKTGTLGSEEMDFKFFSLSRLKTAEAPAFVFVMIPREELRPSIKCLTAVLSLSRWSASSAQA